MPNNIGKEEKETTHHFLCKLVLVLGIEICIYVYNVCGTNFKIVNIIYESTFEIKLGRG